MKSGNVKTGNLEGGKNLKPPQKKQVKLHHEASFDDALLTCEPGQLTTSLKGPTLFHLKGREAQPLFISTLLHGNEPTGWHAIQRLMKKFKGKELPRSLLLFIGNIEAAAANVRTLPWQMDYNRVWPGTPHPQTPEAALMQELFEVVKSFTPFASIDIHNNTGHNPLYGCVNKLENEDLHLARLFSRTIVYFKRPRGVQSLALSTICPSVTIECGYAGQKTTIAKTLEFIEAALHLSAFPAHPLKDEDMDLLKTHAIIKVPEASSLSFNGNEADFQFRSDLDHLNFAELDAGTTLGSLGRAKQAQLELHPTEWGAVDLDLLNYQGGVISLNKRAIPAMFTLEEKAIRADCLGYLMHRIDREKEKTIEAKRPHNEAD